MWNFHAWTRARQFRRSYDSVNFLCTFSGFIANYLDFDFVRERVEVNQCLKKSENTVKKKSKQYQFKIWKVTQTTYMFIDSGLNKKKRKRHENMWYIFKHLSTVKEQQDLESFKNLSARRKKEAQKYTKFLNVYRYTREKGVFRK